MAAATEKYECKPEVTAATVEGDGNGATSENFKQLQLYNEHNIHSLSHTHTHL